VIRAGGSIGDDRSIRLRWEWRTFGDGLGAAEARLRALTPESVAESDETYLLSAEGIDAVKLRDGLMDVKHLEQVGEGGLELWKPVLKAPLPITAADARTVLAALRLTAPPDRDAYAVADLADAGAASCGRRPRVRPPPPGRRPHRRRGPAAR